MLAVCCPFIYIDVRSSCRKGALGARGPQKVRTVRTGIGKKANMQNVLSPVVYSCAGAGARVLVVWLKQKQQQCCNASAWCARLLCAGPGLFLEASHASRIPDTLSQMQGARYMRADNKSDIAEVPSHFLRTSTNLKNYVTANTGATPYLKSRFYHGVTGHCYVYEGFAADTCRSVK